MALSSESVISGQSKSAIRRGVVARISISVLSDLCVQHDMSACSDRHHIMLIVDEKETHRAAIERCNPLANLITSLSDKL
jgi:hypothetical protein